MSFWGARSSVVWAVLNVLISKAAEGSIPGAAPGLQPPPGPQPKLHAILRCLHFILPLTAAPSLSCLLPCCVTLMHEGNCFALGGLLKIFITEAASEVWFNLFWETLQRNLLVSEKNPVIVCSVMYCVLGEKSEKSCAVQLFSYLKKIWAKRKQGRQLSL